MIVVAASAARHLHMQTQSEPLLLPSLTLYRIVVVLLACTLHTKAESVFMYELATVHAPSCYALHCTRRDDCVFDEGKRKCSTDFAGNEAFIGLGVEFTFCLRINAWPAEAWQHMQQ